MAKSFSVLPAVAMGIACFGSGNATAGEPITIRTSAITAGGANSTGGDFAAVGTAGQSAAGPMTGGEFSMTGGFASTITCGACRLHGDIDPPGGNCVLDVDDILHVLDAFVFPELFPEGDVVPCGGDGFIDVDDILSTLWAFVGYFDCSHPCPP